MASTKSNVSLLWLFIAVLLCSCSNPRSEVDPLPLPPVEEPLPEFGYVRAPEVRVVVTVDGPARAQVGRWYLLSASRQSHGAWARRRLVELPEETPWLSQPPPALEAEVAANLTWHTEPKGVAKFDCCDLSMATSAQRKVMFTQAGKIRLWATSAAPLDARSNTIEIDVQQ